MNKISRSCYWLNLKNKLKRIISVVAVICLFAITAQIHTYPRIPLKGLFEVLKYNDIGFGHALLHSGWIENMYQYAEGKPYREIEVRKGKKSWRAQYKGDAVANLIRKLWFRYEECHQLLPTKKGYLSGIRKGSLGEIFGKLINCIYRDFDQDSKRKLMMAMHQDKAEAIKKYRSILGSASFEHIKRADDTLWAIKRKIASKLGPELVWMGEKAMQFNKQVQEATKDLLVGIPQETRKKYYQIKGDLRRCVDYLKQQETEFLNPIEDGLRFCKTSNIYQKRTVESIIWALFFHKLENVSSSDRKIRAIHECLAEIDIQSKSKSFQDGSIKFEQLYTQEVFDEFEKGIKELDPDEQVKQLLNDYDFSLHYMFYTLEGKFPSEISQKRYGYEYERGKLSDTVPNCFEAALYDLFSVLWHNPEKRIYDNALFATEILENGQGFSKFRESLKYFYLTSKKGIASESYTCMYDDERFTSLSKLKELVFRDEIQNVSIKDIPVELINSSEMQQEFMNIISNIPRVKYDKEVEGKGFELYPSEESFIQVFNYFYGIEVKSIEELGKFLSTKDREITFKKEKRNWGPDSIKITVLDKKKNSSFEMSFHITYGRHARLSIPERNAGTSGIVKKDVIKKLLEQLNNSRERTMFFLLASEDLLENKNVALDLPALHLIYNSLCMEDPKYKLEIIKDVLQRRPECYLVFKELIHNLIDGFPLYDEFLRTKLNLIIAKADFHKHKTFFDWYTKEHVTKNQFLHDLLIAVEKDGAQALRFYNDLADQIEDINKKQIMFPALWFTQDKVIELILKREEFSAFKNPKLFEGYLLWNAVDSGFTGLALEILEQENVDLSDSYALEALIRAIEKGNYFQDPNHWRWKYEKFRQAPGQEDQYRKVALAMVEHKDFVINHWCIGSNILKPALKAGYKDVVLAIINNKKFKDDAKNLALDEALEVALKKGYMDVALAIVQKENFKAVYMAKPLEVALKKGYFDVVQLIVYHKTFKACYMNSVITMLINNGDTKTALTIINHETFESHFMGDALKVALKKGYVKVVEAIKRKQGKK